MRTVLAVLTAAGLTACAPSAPSLPATDAVALSGGACFRSADIRGHRYADGNTMYLSVRGEGVYRVGMRNNCLTGATSSDPIVTRQPPGSAYICRPIDMDIAIAHRGGGFETACIVDSIAKLTPTEVEALPRRLRP